MSSAVQKGFESVPDQQMVEVPRDFFFEGMQLPSRVYIRINPGNYLLIGKKGDKAALSSLHAFQNQQVGIFVKDIEYATFIQHVTLVTVKVVEEPSVPDAVKMKFLSGLAGDAINSLERSHFTTAAKMQKVAKLVQHMSQTMSGFNQILEVLTSLPNSESKHSMTTCLVSLLICEEMNISLPLAQEKVAMGSLLHDIGLKYLPRELAEKPKHLLTNEDLQVFEQHPIKGADMIRDLKDIPNDVLLIIAEHHENSMGTGYPKRIRDVKISPLGRIVGLADCFAELIFSPQANGKNHSADEATNYIENILGQPYNKQVFLALKNIINKKYLEDRF